MARGKSSDQPEQPSEEQQVSEQQSDQQAENPQAENQQAEEKTERVEISQDNATLLLAAAEELELEASVVKVENNQFVVPANVAERAGVDTIKDDGDDEQPQSEGE